MVDIVLMDSVTIVGSMGIKQRVAIYSNTMCKVVIGVKIVVKGKLYRLTTCSRVCNRSN